MKKILLCIDNSDITSIATGVSLKLAREFDSMVVGVHAYNAFMHEGAFRIMEPVLPSKYRKEEMLRKQREMHNRLINIGMERISISYLKPIQEAFSREDIDFRASVKEGKNFKVLNQIITEEDGELIVIGASGFNSNGKGYLGSVCLRVLRGNDRNFLIVKKKIDLDSPRFVVCLDGSMSAINGLRMARLLAERFGGEIHLVYVFDSKLHKDVFGKLKESLINSDGFSFNTGEQEKIHDQFIDVGLARVGSMILERAEKDVFAGNNGSMACGGFGLVGERVQVPLVKKVLEGYIYRKICEYSEEIDADMIFVGRTGRHFIEGVDLGSVTENVVRYSPCSVFVACHEKYKGWEI